MEYRLQDLIDTDRMRTLLESYSATTDMVTAILDLEGNVLIATGWRRICTEFHRTCPETAGNCTQSDTTLAGTLKKGEKYNLYKCLNGLVDVAVPIVIQGMHLGNLFTGQFLLEPPDEEFFRRQAAEHKFDEASYMEALSQVPIFSEDDIKVSISFLLGLTELLGEMGHRRLEELEMRKAVEKSESKYRTLISTMTHGFALHEIICDEAGTPVNYRFLEINAAFEEMTGLKSDDIIGKTVLEVLPQTEACWIETYGRVALTGTPARVDNFATHIGKYFEAYAYSPAHEQFACIFTDVTERKQAEDALRESETRLVEAQHIANIGDFNWNVETGAVTWSKGMYDLLGYDKSDNIDFSQINAHIHHPDDLERITRWLNECLESGKTKHPANEYRLIRKDGKVLNVQTTISVKFEEGKPLEMVGTIQDITERKQAEEKQQKSHAMLQRAEDLSNQGSWEWDIVNDQWTFSDNWLRIHGCSVSGISRKELMDLAHPEDASSIERLFQDALAGTAEYRLEHRIVRQDDKAVRVVASIGEVVRDSTGRPVNMYGAAQDITESKQTEEALRQSEESMHRIIEGSPLGICTVDLQGNFVTTNSTYERMLGYTKEELSHLSFFEVTHPEDRPENKTLFQRMFSLKADGFSLEKRYIRKDGVEIDVSVHAIGIRGAGGNIEFGTAFVEDITKRKSAERELLAHREHLEELVKARTTEVENLSNEQRTILDSVRALIWYKDTENRFLRVNRAAAESVGLTVADIEGKTAQELFPDEADQFYADDLEVIQSGQPKLGIVEPLGTASGEKIWVLTDKFPYRDDAGKVAGVIVFCMDITERKQAEEEAAKRTRELRTMVNAMAGREVRMAELKKQIRVLGEQLRKAGLDPVLDNLPTEAEDETSA
jgi:PAS domain S-box-containing protein